MEDWMMNKIYQLNVAEGIFYPAFDKYICSDEQVSMDEGENRTYVGFPDFQRRQMLYRALVRRSSAFGV